PLFRSSEGGLPASANIDLPMLPLYLQIFWMAVLMTAYVGMAISMPMKPAMFPAASTTVMTVSGCSFSVCPMTFGVMRLLSICCAMSVMSDTHTNMIGSWMSARSADGMNARSEKRRVGQGWRRAR